MRRGMLMGCVAVWLSACGAGAPTKGEVLSPGVGSASFEVRAEATDLVPVRVLFPADAEGRPLPTPGSRPALVFIQGGLVPASRYAWQGEVLARQGFVVAFPEHPADLAFFGIERGEAARRLLVSPPAGSLLEGVVDPTRIAVGGHSLGGVVAVKLALLGGYDRLVLEASFPDTADDAALQALHVRALSLRGGNDCSANPTAVADGFAKLPGPALLATLEGVTHYQFTDSDAEDHQRGCVAGVSLDEGHARVGAVLERFFAGGLSPSAFSDVAGATVVAR